MISELYDFDIYPIVFLTNEEQKITIHSLMARTRQVRPGEVWKLHISEVEKSDNKRFPGTDCAYDINVTADDNGDLVFPMSCSREGMYFINLYEPREGKNVCKLSVYALDHDMRSRYPYRGDLHMHTCRSDGHETPATVASNYRGHGYDFTVISDHKRYYPSLEAREIFGIDKNDESELVDMLIVPGEEVHLPDNDLHYVNFGGSFSINALVTPNCNQEKDGDNKEYRSFDGECPEPVTKEEYLAMLDERSKNVPLETESERRSYASAEWIYAMQKKAGGLGIFPHPMWLCPTMQVSQSYLDYLYTHPQFDAFEVLGGESYYQHNGFQTAFYYEMKAKGYDYPIVGSTDSHGSTENNRDALICSTIVFANANKTSSLVDAIKAKYTVAVDTISREYRLVGDYRFVKYGSFLVENWYPRHDRACVGEGYYMSLYADGDKKAEDALKAMKGRVPDMLKKYFNIG